MYLLFFFHRYRFDELGVELFSDSDRLSYTSLSRSSSLIQFESLERQLQNDTQISGSSPSIYSYEGANSNCNSNGPVLNNNQEIISEKSIPIAINLPTIKITDHPQLATTAVTATVTVTTTQFTNSDSEPYSSGSTSGSFSSDDCELHQVESKPLLSSDCKTNTPIGIKLSESKKRSSNNFRAKNSVDSLSEDSGYCDIHDIRSLPTGALSLDSSLPNSNDLEDEDGSVIEEKSILSEINQMRNLSLTSRIRSHSEDDDDDDDICYHSMESLNRKFKSRKIDLNIEDSKSLLSAVTTTTKTTTSSQRQRGLKIDAPKEHRIHEHNTMVKNKTENSRQSLEIQREKFISISSPELYESGDNSRKGPRLKLKRNYRQSSEKFRDCFTVSSVPENLNLIAIDREDCWPDITCDTVASKNFNLFDLNYGPCSVSSRSPKVDISASCANLTLLNYSDDPAVDFCYDSHKLTPINRTKISMMNSKMPPAPLMYPSDEEDEDDYIATYRSKELTSLLEEISAHFNKNLSILNDREASYEPQTDVRDELSKISSSKCEQEPPKPPPRARTQIKTSPNHSSTKKSTFDQDPTNLHTTYTQSLEKCNFNVDEPVNVYNSRQNIYLPETNNNDDASKADDLQKSVHKRNFVSSTPNLNYFDFEMRHVQHYSSIDNTALSSDHLSPSFVSTVENENRCTSMKEIPSSNSRASSTGILASHSTGGSRSGLSVSFCPIVSEISWQISHDDEEEEFSDDVDMDPSAGDNYRGIRNDSLVNYYNHEENIIDDDDDDDEEDFDDFRAVGTSTTILQQNTHVKTHNDHVEPTHAEAIDVQHQHHQETPVATQMIVENKTSTHTNNETMPHPANVELNKSPISHKMLVETQTPSEKLITAEQSAGIIEMDNKKISGQSLTTVPQKIVNNDKPSKSSKSKKSIFSRISSGFRFSFRGKKNKKLANDGVVHYPYETNNNSDAKKVLLPQPQQQQQQQQEQQIVDNKVCNTKSIDIGDFVYIPLKDPNDNVRIFNSQNEKLASDLHDKLQNNNNNNNNRYEDMAIDSTEIINTASVDRQSRSMNKQQRESPPRMNNNSNQVMGKPPLPKQPPRIVGTTTKRPSAHAPRASSTPREYDDNGEFYHQNMIGNGLKQQYYSDRARTMDSGHKIGLIETNLDTDETIINGKTQSLMELGIGQNIHNNHNVNNNANRSGIMNRIVGMGGVQVMQNIDTNINNCGNNSERGRPHKSMEFLLDKENHHIILVSIQLQFPPFIHSLNFLLLPSHEYVLNT